MGGDGGYSITTGLVQAGGSLAVVLGLIYLLSHLSRRWLKGGMGFGGRPGRIRIVESRQLAPKKALVLVEVAGEYLLLGSGSDGVTLIKQIDMSEEIGAAEMQAAAHPAKTAFQAKLEGVVARLKGTALLPAALKNRGNADV